MSNKRLIGSFLMIATIVSVALAYLGAVISLSDGAGASLAYFIFGPLMIAPLYAFFVVVGGLTFGLPVLIVLRKLGRSHSRTWLVSVGVILGAMAGALILGAWIGLAGLPFGIGFGGVGGCLSAVLWFEMVESRLKNE